MYRTGSNQSAIVSEIPSIIKDENVIIAPGKENKTVSILNNKFLWRKSISLSSSYG